MVYTNTHITNLINDYIHSERDRKILLRRFVDGITIERLAEEFDMSVSQIKTIIYRSKSVIFDRISAE